MAELAALAGSIASAVGSTAATVGSAVGSAASAVGSAVGAASPYLSAAGTAASVGGTVLEGLSAQAQSKADVAAAQYARKEAQKKANEELAAAGREAQEKRAEGERLRSRQVAVAAASGGGTKNPTILDILADTDARTDYLTSSIMYGGKSRAAGYIDQGNLGVWKAKTAKSQANSAFAGSILEGFSQAATGIYKAKKDGLFG
jgi:hypothetical protein